MSHLQKRQKKMVKSLCPRTHNYGGPGVSPPTNGLAGYLDRFSGHNNIALGFKVVVKDLVWSSPGGPGSTSNN